MMTKAFQKRALLIAGPTASGKSALALDLARQRNGVIINADALQVYSPLRILSARPTPEEEALVPTASTAMWRRNSPIRSRPGSPRPAGRWMRLGRRACSPSSRAARASISQHLNGASHPVPHIADEVRSRWRRFAGDLYDELLKRDPAMAARLLPADRQRVTRALEVVDATGRSLLDWQREGQEGAALEGVEVERIFMDVPRSDLHARAEQRFDRMLAAGALEEARAMMHLDPSLPAMKAIGLPELIAHLKGELSLEEAVEKAKAATRQYIKRQHTWWRGQMKHWGMPECHCAA
jgi:tRNA dimethylallyltransferase